MKKKVAWICAGGVVCFALLQWKNPPRTNPPVKNDFLSAESPPAELAAQFRSACYDCHSHETKWPWYGRIAPVSWGVADDVNRAREHLDLSLWPDDAGRAGRKLRAMSEEIRSGEMPLSKYALVHREARLTPTQRNGLADWLLSQAEKTGAPQERPTPSPISRSESTASTAGRVLFLRNCAHCHGADARGNECPDLHHLDWTDQQIGTRIRTGKKGQMTAFAGKLQPAEIETLIAYLRTLN